MVIINVRDEPRYFHFIEDCVALVHAHWKRGHPVRFLYNGKYSELITPFADYPHFSKSRSGPVVRRLAGDFYSNQQSIAKQVRTFYGFGFDPQYIVVCKRKRNRKWANPVELLTELERNNFGYKILCVDFEDLSIREQVKLMSQTRILVAAHGAGLTNAMFLPQGCGVIEVFPHAFFWTGYSRISRCAGAMYVPIEADPSPDRLVRLMPRVALEHLGDREITRYIYNELAAMYGRDPVIGPQIRTAIRDVELVPISPSTISSACRLLLSPTAERRPIVDY